jgi:hypothetical protein
MSWNGFNSLNLTGIEAESGRKTLKPGSYTLKITGAEVRETKDKTGHFVLVEFTDPVTGGQVEDVINVHNRNPQAVEIGMKRLKSLLIACGHPTPDRPGDIKSLIGRMVGVHVEQGAPWTDKNGQQKPGGGEPRRSGAYYKPEGGQTSGGDAFFAGQQTGSFGGTDLNDDIPF